MTKKRTGNFGRNQVSSIEDEYIQNLHQQIYYLELQMKLLKDQEIESKNKMGGFGKQISIWVLKLSRSTI
jgi:hypothetical protein